MNLFFNSGNTPCGTTGKSFLLQCLDQLEINLKDASTLPFGENDTSVGTENELQVCVKGSHETVDLAQTISKSQYYANILKRVKSGEVSSLAARNLEKYLTDNEKQIWENSWVRFPFSSLNELAKEVFDRDLLADKSNPAGGYRQDRDVFFFKKKDVQWVRIPISYLLKLSLANIVGSLPKRLVELRQAGMRLASHFLNDNSSPETFSFHVVRKNTRFDIGIGTARETAKRFLFTHLLIQYANDQFQLTDNNQTPFVFSSPHPPIRQRKLNECISDSFYRQLFMSPCLSGWERGEKKQQYMSLCHEVLSRSQLNSILKMREAGIILNNLVVLPQTSNVSLANNGTHISLGSSKLTRAMKEQSIDFDRTHEKYLGDLTAKIVEHFLPLFVSTYTAAPYRVNYHDFHPEKVLGFMPHQLDYTHLRMIWRRWRKKARNRVLGYNLTPFGPLSFDRTTGRLLGCKGDFIPDFRLLDYPVSLLSTEQTCGQDGTIGNDFRLKEDLESLGIFDQRMSLYQLYKLREYDQMGFSGFEGRYYSLFPSFCEDMSRAVELQNLISCLAFKYMASGLTDHHMIPGTPFVESERRQIFFGSAIGLPTFFVKKDTSNQFLGRIVKRVKKSRMSRRYPGYIRLFNKEYQLALIEMIEEDGADIIEMFGCGELLADLRNRINDPYGSSACGKLVGSIIGRGKRPRQYNADDFNNRAEDFYRTELKNSLLAEGWDYFRQDVEAIVRGKYLLPFNLDNIPWGENANPPDILSFLDSTWKELAMEKLDSRTCTILIQLLIASEEIDTINNRERI